MSSSYAVLPSKSARPTKAQTLVPPIVSAGSPVTDPVSPAPLSKGRRADVVLRVRRARGSAAGSVGSDFFGRDTFKNVTRLVEAAGMLAWWRKPAKPALDPD